MIDNVWTWFMNLGYKGSVSERNPDSGDSGAAGMFTSKANTPDDDIFIHEAIYEMDPDYTVVAVIKQIGDKPAREWATETLAGDIDEISFEGSPEDIQERLDKAILEGLAHRKILMVRESGAIVKFGYKFEDLISR
ncbi:MAG: hypothetical protein IK012_12410 [Fibrobacter sp.]|uniref:hypothetical protein n=1 Tax=Fibrobacter sp. TaxID=35828 RepID=UPI0025C09738|nr:hypothetical protein [Fibrobacter sp.]MBR4786034.1 hypothetical protein [Fibrobacter sp.]